MNLSLEPIWSWPLVILTAIGLGALVVVSYRAQADRLPLVRRRRIVLCCKLAAVIMLLFAMLRPAVQFAETTENTAYILLVRDVSRSMTTADGPAGETRFQAETHDMQQMAAAFDKLKPKIEVRQFDFARGLIPHDPAATEPSGEQSAIGQTLLDLLKETQDRNTLAVVLLSDGAQRAITPNDADPLAAAQSLAEAQVQLYTSVYGAAAVSQAALDLAVEDLLIDPVVFENKLVPISVRLRAAGAKDRKVTVRVLVENRQGILESGELVPAPATQNARPVFETTLRTDKESLPVELTFVPQLPGEIKIAVEVIPVEGELLTRNNRVETIISVRQGGVKVAYFDEVRPDVKFLMAVNGADKIQLDYQRIWKGAFADRTRFNDDWFERGKYDVYVIGDVPAQTFGPARLAKLAERLNDGASLLMTGGKENFSAGGYANTPIAEYIPVELSVPSVVTDDSESEIPGRLRMTPTLKGLRQYVMQIDTPEKNRARWQSLPPLVRATKLTPKHELVDVWAEADGVPVLLAATNGRARIAAFGGDTTWRWVQHGQGDAHQRFWRQMILWLARKDADGDQAVWAKVEPRNFSPGAPVTVTFGARDAEGIPIDDAEFQVEIISPKQERFQLTPRKTAQDQIAEFLQTQEAGDYWVRVSATKNGEALGPAAQTRFIVDPRDLELDHPSADPDLMRQLATITGGAPLKPDELAAWAKRLSERKFGDLTQVETVTLWDNWWALLAFAACMTLEWALRKRWGLA